MKFKCQGVSIINGYYTSLLKLFSEEIVLVKYCKPEIIYNYDWQAIL